MATAADPLDLALLEKAVLIRKHVPDLMQKAAMIWPDLEVRERKQHERDLIEALEKLSASGEQLQTERRKSLIDDFKRLIAHVGDRTRPAD
ncbi:hypothetical protein [Sphingomonas montanisoli]|uniref:Uncharacterized protein n=1 Tax=Sphingomonas montanisoli TaxID=2606412 RepID=A0A5D9CD67_9SPHN|nr:hypothetical protein [Sphingomonas montanisoli]TZG29277.1 hypothetical protein FYJ91_03870 [Sphingomonas montanisoli]